MTKRFVSDSPTWEEIKALRQPRTDTVWVPLDADLLDEIDQLQKRIPIEERKDQREHRRPVAPQLQKRLDQLLDEAERAAVPFRLTEIPRRVYRRLLDLHPASDEDKQRGIQRWHEDGFAPALIAASCLEPVMVQGITRDQYLEIVARSGTRADHLREHIGPAIELWEEWPASSAYAVFAAAYQLQEGSSEVPFIVRRSGETHGSEPSSTTAPLEESPTASS